MRAPRWEYKTLHIDVQGFFGPKVKPEALDAELNAHGDAGWELVSAFDVNRADGTSSALLLLLKRPRD